VNIFNWKESSDILDQVYYEEKAELERIENEECE